MKRLFNEHKKRNVIDLSGSWTYKLDENNEGLTNGWQNGLCDADITTVPSCWNNELRLLNYEGKVWYEKKFDFDGGTAMLEFESVMTEATVWLDGNLLGKHYGAFTQFQFIVNDVASGEHTLVVCADSTIDKKSFPQRHTDWFNYGGIARDVFAHQLKGISILNNHIVYELSKDLKSASVCAELTLYNAESTSLSSNASVTLGDNVIYSDNVELNGYEQITFKTPCVTLNDIELWDVFKPNLYTVCASTDTDDFYDRVGFRFVEVKDNNILLNGRSVELRGVNRHEEHPDWGFAFPAKLMKKDIDLILNMGCNTIRGSHYPNSKIFLDMLDEKGILFWSEIPMWGCGFSWEALQDQEIINRGYEMHKEMTKFYYNHPSIIIWGMHNEIDTSQEFTIPLTKLYYGWYGYGGSTGKLSDWDKFVSDLRVRLKDKGWYGKPVIMSEFGAAALAGYHTPIDTVRWSEEYQRDLIAYCIELFKNTEYMRGTYVWQFANIRTSPDMDINRVRYFNNKGIVDEYRNPKLSYFKIKELYEKYANQ